MKGMKMRETISLNGKWRFRKDIDKIGIANTWNLDVPLDTEEIDVPSMWGQRNAPGYNGVAWYWRKFSLGEVCQNSKYCLRFGAVNTTAVIWLNGKKLGVSENGYTPFSFDVTEVLKKDNQLVVMLENSLQGLPVSKQTWYYNYGGIWQDVELDILPYRYIKDVFVEAGISGNVNAHVELSSEVDNEYKLSYEVLFWKQENCKEEDYTYDNCEVQMFQKCGSKKTEIRCVVENPKLWSPEFPYLYTFQARLCKGDALIDELSVRFGFREFIVNEGEFRLNGSEIILKGTLLQPNYPVTYLCPLSREDAYHEIMLHKMAGFNMVRCHIKPAHPWTLDAADELGILIYSEPAIGWMSMSSDVDAANHGLPKEELLFKRAWTDARDMILRDRNHPSIVIWGMLNESGGAMWNMREKLSLMAREIDPSRIIIDDAAVLTGERYLWNPYSSEKIAHWHGHPYRRSPVTKDIFEEFMTLGQKNGITFVSEYGYGGMNDLPDVVEEYGRRGISHESEDFREYEKFLDSINKKFLKYGMNEIFTDVSHMLLETQKLQEIGDRAQTEALRLNSNVNGYIVTQWNDSSWEMSAGIVDQWRRPKRAYNMFCSVNKQLYMVIRLDRYTIREEEKPVIRLWLINENKITGAGLVRLIISGIKSYTVQKEIHLNGEKIQQINVEDETERFQSAKGCYKILVRLLINDSYIVENDSGFLALQTSEWKYKDGICLINESAEIISWVKKKGISIEEADEQKDHNRLVLVDSTAGNDKLGDDRIRQLIQRAIEGDTVIFLGVTERILFFLPHEMYIKSDVAGMFVGAYHYNRKHPVFEGLPAGGLMLQEYANVLPDYGVAYREDPEYIDISCGVFSNNYFSPEFWWAHSILSEEVGNGKLVISTLKLKENLEEDPIAGTILLNLLHYYNSNLNSAQTNLANIRSAKKRYNERCKLMSKLEEDAGKWQLDSFNGKHKRLVGKGLEISWKAGEYQKPGQWFMVDIGMLREIYCVVLDSSDCPYNYPRGICIEISVDKEKWEIAANNDFIAQVQEQGVVAINFTPRTARFVRVIQTGYHDLLEWSIYKLMIKFA